VPGRRLARRLSPSIAVLIALEETIVDVRIGITQVARELLIELPDDTDRESLKAAIDAALSGAADTLNLTDRRGREVLVPSAKIAYVELGLADGDRRMGFGT
jgi:hypothetical protein